MSSDLIVLGAVGCTYLTARSTWLVDKSTLGTRPSDFGGVCGGLGFGGFGEWGPLLGGLGGRMLLGGLGGRILLGNLILLGGLGGLILLGRLGGLVLLGVAPHHRLQLVWGHIRLLRGGVAS